MVFGNFFALAFLFSLKTPNFAFGEDRPRLNNSHFFLALCSACTIFVCLKRCNTVHGQQTDENRC